MEVYPRPDGTIYVSIVNNLVYLWSFATGGKVWLGTARPVLKWPCLLFSHPNTAVIKSRQICGIGGSDYVPKDALKDGAFRDGDTCQANPTRVEAARNAFTSMASGYEKGELARTAACMRPCAPDAMVCDMMAEHDIPFGFVSLMSQFISFVFG